MVGPWVGISPSGIISDDKSPPIWTNHTFVDIDILETFAQHSPSFPTTRVFFCTCYSNKNCSARVLSPLLTGNDFSLLFIWKSLTGSSCANLEPAKSSLPSKQPPLGQKVWSWRNPKKWQQRSSHRFDEAIARHYHPKRPSSFWCLQRWCPLSQYLIQKKHPRDPITLLDNDWDVSSPPQKGI